MFSILVFGLLSVPILCQDWCKLVKPGGVYNGLGLFHRFYVNGIEEYLMYNRDDAQWKLEVKADNGLISLDIKHQTAESVSERDVINKIGTLITDVLFACECIFTKSNAVNQSTGHCICKTSPPEDSFDVYYRNNAFENAVILKSRPAVMGGSGSGVLLAFDKNNRRDPVAIDLKTNETFRCASDPVRCVVPKFVNGMDDTLFQSIESVIDFNEQPNVGYILLFTIDGKPKYCFTSEERNISEECKSSDKMIPLFEECFVSEDTDTPDLSDTTQPQSGAQTQSDGDSENTGLPPQYPPPENSRTPVTSNNKESSKWWLWLLIIIAIVVLLAMVFVIFLFLRSKSDDNEGVDKLSEKGASSPPVPEQKIGAEPSSINSDIVDTRSKFVL